MKINYVKLGVYKLILLSVLSLNFFITSCKEDDEEVSNEVVFKNIAINGAKEVPANNSAATGVFNGVFNKDTKMITYTITFSGITPSNMHFHKGASTVSGPVVIGIGGPYTSPLTGTTRALTADEEADLLAGNWYVNVHSSAFPGGEIRAQVVQ